MNIVISVGFWLFWPTINALIQELSNEDQLAGSEFPADGGGVRAAGWWRARLSVGSTTAWGWAGCC